MEELLSAIKIVKMYCWESAFLERIIGKGSTVGYSELTTVWSLFFLILVNPRKAFRKEEMKRIKRRFYPAFIIAKVDFQIDAHLRPLLANEL